MRYVSARARRARSGQLAARLAAAVVWSLLGLAALAPSAIASEILAFRAYDTASGRSEVFKADGDGRNPIPRAPGPEAALSPGGQTLVYVSSNRSIRAVDAITGMNDRSLFYKNDNTGQLESTFVGGPAVSPSGDVLFEYTHECFSDYCIPDYYTNGSAVYSVGANGSGLRPVVDWPGDQRQPATSSEGGFVVFVSATTPDGSPLAGPQVWIANSDGSEPRRLTTDPMGFTSTRRPTLSPDGQVVAFAGRRAGQTEDQIYRIGVDGRNLKQLTTDGGTDPQFRPHDTHIAYTAAGATRIVQIDVEGGSRRTLVAGPPAGYDRIGPVELEASDQLFFAKRYEPVLRFDSSESWRPLDVDAFFAEHQHRLCDASCDTQPIQSVNDLARHATKSSYIDIAGRYIDPALEANYHSPYPECNKGGLRDCDVGSRSTIYYRVVPEGRAAGYNFVDYWFFYRANYFYKSFDFHEGDWEGVSVGVSPQLPSTFDFVAFSQHGTYFAYLRQNLRCEDVDAGGDTSESPPRGTCGSDAASYGHRVDSFVANGSHANYGEPCPEHFIGECPSAGSFGGRDRGYDGRRRWGRAFDEQATSLLPLPPTVGWHHRQGFWSDWPGRWGHPGRSPDVLDGPRSPGVQPVHWECAESGCGPIVAASAERSTGYQSPGTAARSCTNWLGGGVAALECDRRQLRHAFANGTLGHDGFQTLTVSGRHASSASVTGVTQLLGAPLRDGGRVHVEGAITRGDELFIHIQDRLGKHLVTARFTGLRKRLGRRVRHGDSEVTLRFKLGRHLREGPTLSLGRRVKVRPADVSVVARQRWPHS